MVGNEPDLPYEHTSTGQKMSLSLLRPLDKYHRLGALDSKHFSLTVLKPGKPKIKVPADLVPGENLLPGWLVDGHPLVGRSHGESRDRK